MDRSDGAFSVFVSDTMDNMGYDSCMVQHRRDMYRDMRIESRDGCIISGSKGEGITRYLENDFDVMIVHSDIRCAEDVSHTDECNVVIFNMDRCFTSPGYTRLRSNYVTPDEYVLFDLFDRDISIGYVSHYLMEHIWGKMTAPYNFSRKGPSFWTINTMIGQQGDFVPSMKCDCPSILISWLSRRRINDWPSQQTIVEVSALDAHVVPVGCKHSPHQKIEWRICYTLAEQALIHSLNDTQLKMYILLKFIAKSVLNPVCGAMTSYVMKNIVLWMCENTPSRLFTPRLLVDRLLQCLKILRFLVKQQSIPSYMIPERNMYIERKVPGQHQKLLSLLSELIDEGPCLLFRSDKLCLAMVKMYKNPEIIRQECQKKNKLERFELLLFQVSYNSCTPANLERGLFEILQEVFQKCCENELFSELSEQMAHVVIADKEQLENAGENSGLVYVDRLVRLLS